MLDIYTLVRKLALHRVHPSDHIANIVTSWKINAREDKRDATSAQLPPGRGGRGQRGVNQYKVIITSQCLIQSCDLTHFLAAIVMEAE